MSEHEVVNGPAGESGQVRWSVDYARNVLRGAFAAGRALGFQNRRLASAAAGGDPEWETLKRDDADQFRELFHSLVYCAEVPVAGELEAGVAYWLELAIEAAAMRGLGAAHVSHSPSGEDDADSVVEELIGRMIGLLVGSGCSFPGAQEFMNAASGPARIHVLSACEERAEMRTSWQREFEDGSRFQWCVLRQDGQVQLGIRRCGEAKVTPILKVHVHDAGTVAEMFARAVA